MSNKYTTRVIGLASFANFTEKKSFMNDPNEVKKYSCQLWLSDVEAKKVQAMATKMATELGLKETSYIKDMNGNNIPVPGWKSPVLDGRTNKHNPNKKNPELETIYTSIMYPSSLYDMPLFDCRGTVTKLSLDEAKEISWSGAEIVMDISLYNKTGKDTITAKISAIGYRKQLVSFSKGQENPFDAVTTQEDEEKPTPFDAVK